MYCSFTNTVELYKRVRNTDGEKVSIIYVVLSLCVRTNSWLTNCASDMSIVLTGSDMD